MTNNDSNKFKPGNLASDYQEMPYELAEVISPIFGKDYENKIIVPLAKTRVSFSSQTELETSLGNELMTLANLEKDEDFQAQELRVFAENNQEDDFMLEDDEVLLEAEPRTNSEMEMISGNDVRDILPITDLDNLAISQTHTVAFDNNINDQFTASLYLDDEY